MVKGIAVKFKSYGETIPKLLKVIKFDDEIKKHETIVLKPNLIHNDEITSTNKDFVESILKFCVENKSPGAQIFIAEGSDGHETEDVFDRLGYTNLAEKYGVGLLDLNNTETEEIENSEFRSFSTIKYPKILSDSFVISLPVLTPHEELGVSASLDNMIGAFPAKHYKGFFSTNKNKLHRHSLKHQIHDIIKCKMPQFGIIDASDKGFILAGQPLEMDKQSVKLYGLEWKNIPHLKLIDESFSPGKTEENTDNLIDNR